MIFNYFTVYTTLDQILAVLARIFFAKTCIWKHFPYLSYILITHYQHTHYFL